MVLAVTGSQEKPHAATNRRIEVQTGEAGCAPKSFLQRSGGLRMKIALAHKRFDLRGGAEWVLYQTTRGLQERGHEVHLFCQVCRVTPPSGVIFHRVPGLSWPRSARLLTFGILAPRLIAKYDCDVVMSFDRITTQDVFRSGGGPHKSFIRKMMQRGGFWRKLWYCISTYHHLALFIEKRQVSSVGSRKIIALCEQVKQEFIGTYNIPEEKIVVVYNGVDNERFHPRLRADASKRVRAELGIPADRPIVLFVGTGFRRKGLARLLRLWRHPGMPGICLVIVGSDAKLSSYQRQYTGKEVIFTGPRSNVEDFYGAADLLVLPSVQEGFGNVILEAFATGLPVVTVVGVGAAEVLEGELQEGIVSNPDDPAELKRKILAVLDPLRWEILSRRARRVAEKYTWSAYLDGVEKTLHELSRQSEHSRRFKRACVK
jgi:UDP-glucose:(heptosyl)LPS alpha-1,3-glucosyltransferase